MHTLQPKHTKLSEKDAQDLLDRLNVSKAQLPKIFISDPALPDGCQVGDIIKIERSNKTETDDIEQKNKLNIYFRVVV
ncbi:MAG: DNA-directed RNA polymerase subunit H [Nanoarchaeota archaeon]|nr:DNA-directed RNA polymerase subunit H [Nanoarchaeota archaeon]